jgi:hypothetical protein
MSTTVATSPAPVKAPRTRKPVPRTLRIESDPFGGGFVRITVAGVPSTYRTKQLPCDPEFGVFSFMFHKVGDDHAPLAEPYYLSVSCHDPRDAKIVCDCPAGVRWGHCRHGDALRVLMARRPK